MSSPIIAVDNLSKRYVLGQQRSKDDGFRHVVEDMARLPLQWLGLRPRPNKSPRSDFLALKNISFEVAQGDVVGIVGRNGAGKSTLLKILSRITEPTTGRIAIDGRVASLLEVGTGFHPELTGRENIFLNGAILGMSRHEIRKKFDEIVAFAEVSRFLDTPVKRYSSGMYVRLAFAVAAHLEPEILIVDEVLAVGDTEFQKKCLGKMQDVSKKEGRTVLFVSHNMLAVQKLCTKGILLENGSIKLTGPIAEIVNRYSSTGASGVYQCAALTGQPQILSAKIATPSPRTDAALAIEIEWTLPADLPGVKIGVGFNTSEGQRIFDCAPEDLGLQSPSGKGRYRGIFTVPPSVLMARHYGISIGIWRAATVFDHQNPALTLAMDAAPTGPYAHEGTREGLVHVGCTWKFLS